MSKSLRKSSRRRSFMSRLSETLLSSPPKFHDRTSCSKMTRQTIQGDRNSLEKDRGFQHSPEDTDEPGYASVPDLKSSKKDDESPPPPIPPKMEASYSTVIKKHQKKNANRKLPNQENRRERKSFTGNTQGKNGPDVTEILNMLPDSFEYDTTSVNANKREKSPKNYKMKYSGNKSFEEELYQIKSRHWVDFRRLHEEMQQTEQENEMLRHKVAELLKQENQWKHDMTEAKILKQENQYALENNAVLNRRITKLEADTKQEVNLFLEQVNLLKHEKDTLVSQFQVLQREHQSVLKDYNRLRLEKKSMISVECHMNEMKQSQRVLDETKAKYEEELEKMKNEHIMTEEEKNDSKVQLKLVKEEKLKVEVENKCLKESLREAHDVKESLIREFERMKQNEYEILDLLGSLLKMTEEIITERDVVLKKSALQEEQRQMIHITTMGYSMNVGRLQEHMTNTKRKVNEQLERLLANNYDKDRQFILMKKSYEKQLEVLKKKVMQQNYDLTHISMDNQ